MITIVTAQDETDIELTDDQESSFEINLLYNEFKDLISAKKFENNNFMQKPDALAVIDLAEACNMFDGMNYKAAGICYNNIANIQYKNEKYAQAAENFFHAIEQAKICLGKLSPQQVYSKRSPSNNQVQKQSKHAWKKPEKLTDPHQLLYYQKVLANRTYQYAISIYKELRYKEGGKKDKQLNWQKVDAWLRKAIELYQKIQVAGQRYDPNEQQPLFIDLIIKITIIRSYANLQNQKLLTSEKLLEFAKVMITLLEKGDIEIMDDLVEREYAEVIPLDILKQKYLLNSATLFIALN